MEVTDSLLSVIMGTDKVVMSDLEGHQTTSKGDIAGKKNRTITSQIWGWSAQAGGFAWDSLAVLGLSTPKFE